VMQWGMRGREVAVKWFMVGKIMAGLVVGMGLVCSAIPMRPVCNIVSATK